MKAMLAAALALWSALLCGQRPEYEFYGEFREFYSGLWTRDPSITPAEILERYTAKLKADGVAGAEVARRRRLLATERAQLEADRWDRFYGNRKNDSTFNQGPNEFLAAFVRDRRPGVALDYAMGTGRNALYLAKLGWEVYGFDHSAVAVHEAEKRARELGLKLNTAAVADSAYDFGCERFDLIVFSWAMPLVDVKKVVSALKPGGVVLMEAAADYVGLNGMLKKFDDLRIERYELVKTTADWYDRREVEVVRLVATKPR